MKKVFLISALISVLGLLNGFGQNAAINKMISDHKGEAGVWYLQLTTNLQGQDSENVNEALELRLISFDQKQNASLKADNLMKNFFRSVDRSEYKGLVDVKSSGDQVEIMVKKNSDKIEEMILAVEEEDGATFISAYGNFDLKDLLKMAGDSKCKSLEVLELLCEE